MKRGVSALGKALRETGQALDRMGMRAQDSWIFQEKICRHRAVMNLFDQRPFVSETTYVAPNASVIGNVNLKDQSSVWYGAVIRGDQSPINVGGFSSIGDRSSVLSTAINPTGFVARTYIGDWVTVGQGCVLKGCTIDDYAVVGDGSVVQEGALVEAHGVLEPGSVLPSGMRVPAGEVYGGNPASFVRKLEKEEMEGQAKAAEKICALAQEHMDEFLPYGTLYQNKEALTK